MRDHPPIPRSLLRLLALILPAWLAGCSSLFFHPMDEHVRTPGDLGLVYEDVVLEKDDEPDIHGWWIPTASEEPKGTVYHLHGNAENISTHIGSVLWMLEEGYHLYLLDYRGFGKSDGRATVSGAQQDAIRGLQWLESADRTEGPVIVFGQSIGAAIAIGILGDESNSELGDCLISEAAFTGYRDITRDVMRQSWLLWPLSFVVAPLMPEHRRPLDQIESVSPRPLLLLHSEEDEIIPFAHGERLYERAGEGAMLIPMEGNHIRGVTFPEIRGLMLDFMDNCES